MILALDKSTGVARCKCPTCGGEFIFQFPPAYRLGEELEGFFVSMIQRQPCDGCVEKNIEARRRQEEKERLDELKTVAVANGIPSHMLIEEPPKKAIANWLYMNRGRNILLSGDTGTGKSTSLCAVLYLLCRKGMVDFRYYPTMSDLAMEYAEAKTGTSGDTRRFLSHLKGLDVLAIDEVVDKGRITESTEELVFKLVDLAYSGGMRGRLWMAGNLARGFLDTLVKDSVPFRRKIRESFICGIIRGGAVELSKV